MKALMVLFVVLIMTTANAADIKSPHEMGNISTGVISGALLKDGKTPLLNYKVTLEILQGHELVLTIPKVTDAKGRYQFKNIFQSKDFSYAVSTEYEGKTYRSNFVSLKSGEGGLNLDLLVGKGAKNGPNLPLAMSGEMMQKGETEVIKKSTSEYKFLAALLSICAIGYALWQRKKA